MAKPRDASTAKGKKKRPGKKVKERQESSNSRPPEETPKIAPMVDDVPQTPSAKLAVIVGKGPLTLRQANQIAWAYIQRKGLQDQEQKHMISARTAGGVDRALKDIIGEKPVSMFELTEKLRKLLS
jgi:chromatin remodeling complex protein RSC6